METFLFTSESVNEGHPDKLCDQISDAVLDACLTQDPDSKVACETCTKTNMVMVFGEITTKADVDYEQIVRKTCREIGFISDDVGLDADHCKVLVNIEQQSPDIAQGVHGHFTKRPEEIGAGDQGHMFGYATDETPELMPLTHVLATKLGAKLTEVRKNGTCPWLRPDGKTQVTIEYRNEGGAMVPERVHTVLISTQHDETVTNDQIAADLKEHVIKPVIPEKYLDENTIFHLNPSGRFVIGGPHGDAGLTGRKIIIDTYGGWGAHGGGAFSGKDPTKVDRSGAYIVRQAAKSIVAAARISTLLGITFSLTYLNYRGLTIVGFAAVGLAIFSLIPFAVIGVLSIPRLKPRQWLIFDLRKTDWRGYFNSLFWNLNYWDKASTLAGEVESPSKNFPKALMFAVILVVSSYLIPLLAGTGAIDLSTSEWTDGYFAEVAMLIGGAWLKWWIQAAAAMSNMGLFEAEMSGDAFQLLGMSEMGMLPEIFSHRSKHGTPTFSIICSATGVIVLSWMSFQEILEFLNFLYCIGMLLEFAAFVWLRIKHPDLQRPYKVPLNTFWVTVLCIPPSVLLIIVMCLAAFKTIIICSIVVVVGFLLYPCIGYMKARECLKFAKSEKEVIVPTSEGHEQTEEDAIGLLTDLFYEPKEKDIVIDFQGKVGKE